MPTTVLAIITKAMQHIGAIATGETPSAAESADGLIAFNDVLETLNLQNLAVYGAAAEAFTTIAGQARYTIGATGDWVTSRPVSIGEAFCTVQGIDFPIDSWTYPEYMAVAYKADRSSIIERLVYVNDYPLGVIYLFPTPDAAVTVSIDTMRQLTAATLVSDTVSVPPGYARMLAYAVAVELAPQYGAAPPVAYAAATLALVKRANRVPALASFDATLVGGY